MVMTRKCQNQEKTSASQAEILAVMIKRMLITINISFNKS